ncbi:MAG TPA: hypothetical protein VL595_07850 [Pseudonocardia sp.]|jgi:hypothetical protein|nr:hypothetical protein [Pseudonocardia sp.]
MRQQTRLLALIATLTTLIGMLSGCGSIPGLPGSSASGSGGAPLWPDVPPLPGATQVAVELPLPVKLLVKSFVNAAQSPGDNNGQESRDYDLKVYQAQGTGTDVSGFYTQDLMSTTGWTRNETSCGASSPLAGTGSTLCLYTKPAADGFTDNLAILLMPGEGEGGSDQVAYVRFSSKG